MCEWKIMDTEETELERNHRESKRETQKKNRENNKEKIEIWKRNNSFLNILRNITFTILVTFQNFVIITLSILRPRTTHHLRFLNSDSHSNFWVIFNFFLELRSKFVQFCTKFEVKLVLFFRRNLLVFGYLLLRNKSLVFQQIFDFI